ncbi:Outer membrane protein beta-barrel domain [Shewanella psychrophila]|uniref:Outer membrane protein beta-barrel domain n=1 Tax=Shewanella psychrophila TaxID=225848 RepID=A0A1S6HX10_9GAMM|nr:outer membrane beta-barrel protein [Shewanella psychrophila]AQS40083.1 Outer membrane protein beta-barrel domain [Shewanella psychrophila]
MKTSIVSRDSHNYIVRGLSVLSLILVNQPRRNMALNESKAKESSSKKSLSFPFAWLGVLCCLFIFQTSANEVYEARVNKFILGAIPYLNSDVSSSQQQKLTLDLKLNGGNPLEIGYKFTPKWQVSVESIEVGLSLDSFSFVDASDNPYTYTSYQAQLYTGWGVSLGYNFELSSAISSQVYLGAYRWQQDRSNSISNSTSEDGLSPYLGLGVKYRLSDKVNVRFDWHNLEIQEDGFDQFGIYLDYRF